MKVSGIEREESKGRNDDDEGEGVARGRCRLGRGDLGANGEE